MAAQPEPSIAVIGATGVVGRTLLEILATRFRAPSVLRLFASSRSAGSTLKVGKHQYQIESLDAASLKGFDLVFLCAGAEISREYAPRAVRHGAWVIDNSSAFRMDASVPLVIPEVNPEVLEGIETPQVIANPNCSTILGLIAVNPIRNAVGIERLIMSTYQAASGGGQALMDELENQIHDHAAGRPYRLAALDRPYLLNAFSHETAIDADGYNGEERKIINETRKIWNQPNARITATCVRIPVLRSHCESITLTLKSPLKADTARGLMAEAPGLTVWDDQENGKFPEPFHASGRDDVLIGRIRNDLSQPEGTGLHLFLAGDQLRKGAALNSVQIAELLLAKHPSLHR